MEEEKDEVVVGDVGGVVREEWSGAGVVTVVGTSEGLTVPINVGEGVPVTELESEST